jgi:VIT1/CCC1 family predicted Fe2+/Mn2+ transporter
MKDSKLLSLNAKDLIKGLIVAILTALITYLYEAVQTENFFTIETLKKSGMVALAALLGYLIKNFFSTPKSK